MWEKTKLVTNILARRVGRGQDIKKASVKAVVEQPEEAQPHDPPVFLPNQLAKATAGSPGHQSVEAELQQATATTLVHAPVVRYLLEDCLVHPAGVEFKNGSYRIQRLDIRKLVSGHLMHTSKALYCTTGASHTFFGHWLQDECATALLRQGSEALLLAHRPDWPHAGQYLQAFGTEPVSSDVLHVEQLAIYDDRSQGSSKRKRYNELRRRLERVFPESTGDRSRVYFRRGSTGVARPVANEDSVIVHLKDRGFDVVDLAGASVRDIITRFRSADFVVSMDGSHLNHLYFALQPGAKLMTFVPANCFTMNQRGYCAALDIGYGFMVVDPTPAGYNVSIPDLSATLDIMGL